MPLSAVVSVDLGLLSLSSSSPSTLVQFGTSDLAANFQSARLSLGKDESCTQGVDKQSKGLRRKKSSVDDLCFESFSVHLLPKNSYTWVGNKSSLTVVWSSHYTWC